MDYPVNTKPPVVGDVVLWETGEGFDYCRDEATVTVGAGETLEVGQVLEAGASTADYDAVATDASAAAILLTRITDTSGSGADIKAAVMTRSPAILKESGLIGGTIAAAVKAALVALGFIVRSEGEIH